MVSSDVAGSGPTIASVESGTSAAASHQPQEASGREQRPTETLEQAARRLLTHKAPAAICFAVVALVFVAGMALLASGLHWWGLCLVCTALLLLVSVCLLPAGGRAPEAEPQTRRPSLGQRCVAFPGEPIPVSVCPHLQLRTLSGNAVPYLLEEVTLADVSRMYPPPFPPPPYHAKVMDARRKL